MTQLLVDRSDIDFVIWEQFDGEARIQKGGYEGFGRKVADMMITEARKLAIKEVLPTLQDGDRLGVAFENGAVKVPKSFHRPYQLLKQGEWRSIGVSEEMGGQGGPLLVHYAAEEYFNAANWSLMSYMSMNANAAKMIQLFGTPEQKATYVNNMVSGLWGGTMLLTEPGAGSDVGALQTEAVRNTDGTYSLTGNKIFITSGEHDLAENIIHPVLARVVGAPPGTQGISIFIVPKFLVNADGTLGPRNDIVCTGLEEKMGIHGSATCSMNMGAKNQCIGYLLGEENQGMKIMFHMMNAMRMEVAISALSQASAAYLLALNYARERIQGRDIENHADRTAPAVPIINHPDVRRNLLKMKSYVNGMRSFFYFLVTVEMQSTGATLEDKKRHYENYLSFFTPVLKEYLSTKSHSVCIDAMQVHGGSGYTQDYSVEQYARDARIHSIFEGTSGIQAMDLLARKLMKNKGQFLQAFLADIDKIVARALEMKDLAILGERVAAAASRFKDTAFFLAKTAASDRIKVAFAHSLPFLHAMGDLIMAWMLLWRAVVACEKLANGLKRKQKVFYQGQVKTAEFFIRTLLPASLGIMQAIQDSSDAAIEIVDEALG